jgi:predicted Zn-dependent peptidase
MDLILVGGLPSGVEGLIEKHFGRLPPGERQRLEFPIIEPPSKATVIHVPAPDLRHEQRHEESSAEIILGTIVPHESSPQGYALRTLNYILGGDASSRLFLSVSQRKGLAYHIRSYYGGNNNAGFLEVRGAVASARLNDAFDAIFMEMQRLQTEAVPQEELARFKRKVAYHVAKAFETNQGHVYAIERKLDEGFTPEQYVAGLDAVTPEQVLEAARHLPSDRDDGKYALLIRDPLKAEETSGYSSTIKIKVDA